MIAKAFRPALAAACLALSACGALDTDTADGPPLIAKAADTASQRGGLTDGRAAISVTPDGCQVWIIDNGVEGYAVNRHDPRTGLPVCNADYPPGAIVGELQSSSLLDFLPR